jgi:hypothetical protein
MRTSTEMADRSDRREGKPVTRLGVQSPCKRLAPHARIPFWPGDSRLHSSPASPLIGRRYDCSPDPMPVTKALIAYARKNTVARGNPVNPSRTPLNLDSEVELDETALWFAPGRVFSRGVATLPLPKNHQLRATLSRGQEGNSRRSS